MIFGQVETNEDISLMVVHQTASYHNIVSYNTRLYLTEFNSSESEINF